MATYILEQLANAGFQKDDYLTSRYVHPKGLRCIVGEKTTTFYEVVRLPNHMFDVDIVGEMMNDDKSSISAAMTLFQRQGKI